MVKRNLIFGWFCLVMFQAVAQTVLVENTAFRCKYDQRLQIPTETRWTVHKSDIGKSKREPSWRFVSDLPQPLGIATHGSYKGSGFHRGHMCPAADRSCSTQYMRQTFVMSNICPQYPSVNVGLWKKTEECERKLALRHGAVNVLTIPMFFDKDTIWIGGGKVAVPHAYLKLIYNINPDTLYNIFFVWNRK